MGSTAQALEAAIWRRGAEITARARDRMDTVVRRAAPVGESLPGGRAPGTLKRSVEVAVRRQPPESYVLTVRVMADHAIFTIVPTRPHPIRPRRTGGVLVFYWPAVGETVFLPSVNHPGTTPSGWWEEALGQFNDVLEASQ